MREAATPLDSYDGRLSTVERNYQELRNEVRGITVELERVGRSFDKFSAKIDGSPKITLHQILTQIKDVGVLIGMASAAIIFIATSISSVPIATIQKDVTIIAQRLDRLDLVSRGQTVLKSDPLTHP
jgi:hypothetical protein